MALQGATPVLRQDMTMNPGASMSPFTALHFSPPTPRTQYQPLWEQHQLPLMTSSCPPSMPLGLSVFPKPPLVTGVGGPGPNMAVTGNIILQVRSEGELPVPQTVIVTQTPLNWNTPGTVSGTVLNAPPPFVAASAMEQLIPATSVVDDSSCNSKSVYENYRRWQCFKPLARRHHLQSPDTEALSCFLIPVMRSLAQLKPTMILEEGLWRSVQEWQDKSNFDRMIYYEMAGKFMEFEADEMQIQKLQQRKGSAHLPPPVPQKFHPPKTSDTVTGQHPDRKCQNTTPQEAATQIQVHLGTQSTHEAMKEYADIMEDLLGLAYSATGEPNGKEKGDNEQQQEKHDIYTDPGLLNYNDKLCSQEAFVTKVEPVIHLQFLEMLLSPESQTDPLSLIQELEQEERLTLSRVVAVIHPQFLEMLLSPEPQADPLSLIQELEQEEGLTHTQLMEKRLLKLREAENVEALPSYNVL
ncbi:PREDICTED: NUT family member 2G-like [Chrysochloris asiatica]|uniref:NUT family member 2G-like n=1 Tax=Chrysochloris asiatica TaxID=185453 RepID=A0A9B0UBP0_CHRAS|nr:PREDICTED: NUT family member 2G-like [Chrysochloris asiatica]